MVQGYSSVRGSPVTTTGRRGLMCFYGIDSKVVFQSVPRNVSFTIHKQIVSQAVLQVLAFKAEGGRLDRIRRSLCRCVPGRRIRMLRPVLPSELIVYMK